MPHIPFAIEIELRRPILLGRFPPMLDAILETIATQLGLPPGPSASGLAVSTHHGHTIPHASCLLIEVRTTPSVPALVHRVRGLRPSQGDIVEDLAAGRLIPGGRGARSVRHLATINPTTGPYANRLGSSRAYDAPSVWALAVGNIDVVCDLLSTAGGVGKRTATGWGAIETVRAHETAMDISSGTAAWIDVDGSLLRPLPEALADEIGADRSKATLELRRTKPPYWLPEDREPMLSPLESSLFGDKDEIEARLAIV